MINPPFYRFLSLEQDYVPLSLLAVGSKLIEDGHEVYIKNMEIGDSMSYKGYAGRSEDYDKYLENIDNQEHPVWLELHSLIKEIQPDKIGINVLNVKYRSALTIIKIANQYDIDVVVGGNHPTTEPETYPNDVTVFKGEFESHGGRVHDLDTIPFPNYEMLLDKYSPNGYGHLLSSRGCPFNCSFCASKIMWNRKVTYQSVLRIIMEMTYVEKEFKTDYFTFWDEVFTLNRIRLREFCENYNLEAKWRCDTRADILTEEMVVMMKNANCGQMSLGIESSDKNTLQLIRKGETVEQFSNAAELLNKHNIQWKAYCIIGFPYDTVETISNTISFIKSLNPFRITLSSFTPYKGTDLYNDCLKLGLINENYNMALYSHQSPHNYFCPEIPKKEYMKLRNEVSEDIDNYNLKALKIWK